MILSTYYVVTTLAKPLINSLLKIRCALGKEDAIRLSERRGVPSKNRASGLLIWIHAASVGEAISVLPLINKLHDTCLECNYLVTTGTVSSAIILQERLPERAFHQFVPIDQPGWVNNFLNYWRPDLALWVESEIWPNLLTMGHNRNLPMILINARISIGSYRGWKPFPKTIKSLLNCFCLCMAQSPTDAEKLIALGASKVVTPGNLKFAAPPLPASKSNIRFLSQSIGTRYIWLATSTHPGEEVIILRVHSIAKKRFPNLLTIIAPRHPSQGRKIASLAETAKLNQARRSKGDLIKDDSDIYIVDTVGELGLFYRVAPVSFIGGSLVPHGGQNMLEAAKLDSAVIFGPHTFNFAYITDQLLKTESARKVKNAEELANALILLLGNDDLRLAQTDRARQVVRTQEDVLTRVVDLILPYIPKTTVTPKNVSS